MKTAVVLSGGGAKGAYQLGVWRALRKMHTRYQIVTGTSVGALNGILMVQKSYYTANKIWSNITYKDIYGKEFANKVNSKKEIEVYKQYVKSFFADGGMDITALEKLFGKSINLFKFKHSRVNYGIVTYNVTTMKPIEITKKELLKESVKDYVLASASCFPAIKAKNIKNQTYIDGGYYDNLPINLAIKMGAERVIAVDLQAPGIKKDVVNKNVEIIKIYPRNKIVSFLVFDKELSNKAIKYGYNDTMKTFNKLDGNKFTFKKNSLLKNYNSYRTKIIFLANKIFCDNIIAKSLSQVNEVSNILKNNNFNHLLNEIIEYLGKAYDMDDSNVYGINSFNDELLYEFEKINKIKTTELVDTKKVISYIYDLLISEKLDSKKISKAMLLFRKEFLSAMYLVVLENKY